jgi:hypothetical protein
MPSAENSPFEASYEALEYAFRVRTDLAPIGLVADRLLYPFRRSADGQGPVYSLVQLPGHQGFALRLGRQQLHRVQTPGAILGKLMHEIHGEAIRSTRHRILVHAGAVSWKAKGILLPAEKGSGKTTLVAGLIRAGFDYLTDEAAVIDPESGWLHPYPRPLSLKDPTVDLFPGLRENLPRELGSRKLLMTPVSPSALRRRSVGRSCRVQFVVLPQYRADGPTLLSRISRSEALVALAENSFNFEHFGPKGFNVLADIVKDAECYRLSMQNLESSVLAIQELVQDLDVRSLKDG